MSKRIIRAVVAVLALTVTAAAVCANPPFRSRRQLRVVLYPFVPDKAGYLLRVEQSFESAYPEIDLQIIDLSDNYYDEQSLHAVTNVDADVFELDSVFLADFVAAQRVQPLPSTLSATAESYLPVSQRAVRVGERDYGVPHWVCTNFLFFRSSDSLANAKTLADIRRALGEKHEPGKGLLIDLKGRSTLGEWYLNALLDRHGSMEKANPYLTAETADSSVFDTLKTVRSLCDPDLCRDGAYHDMPGFYARQFARHGGRALAGYSERLYYVGTESLTGCKKGECVSLEEVGVLRLPLSDSGSKPFAWVDSFTIATSCKHQCLIDAEAFIRHTASIDEVRASLMPGYGEAPRYLLPALAALYSDKSLLSVAPLYEKLYAAIGQAVAVRGENLNRNLRAIGSHLDKNVIPK